MFHLQPSLIFPVKSWIYSIHLFCRKHTHTHSHANTNWSALAELAWDASDLAVQQVAGRRASMRWRRGAGSGLQGADWGCWRSPHLCCSSYKKIQQWTPWRALCLIVHDSVIVHDSICSQVLDLIYKGHKISSVSVKEAIKSLFAHLTYCNVAGIFIHQFWRQTSQQFLKNFHKSNRVKKTKTGRSW